MEALIVLLVMLSPVAVLLLVPAALDLVMQDERVRPWWIAPLALWVPMTPFALGVPLLIGPGADRWQAALYLWGTTWGLAALDLAACSMALGLSRGLRPGGPTERWRLGSAALGLPIAAGLVALPFVVGLTSWGWMTLWFGPAGWTVLVWVLALHRSGPARLERGRRAASTWIVLSAASASVALGMFATAGWLELSPMRAQLVGTAAGGAMGMALLGGAVAVMGGPLHRALVAAGALGLGGSMAYCAGMYALSRVDPAGIPLPVARDLLGRPASVGPSLAREHPCVEIPEQGRLVGRCRPSDTRVYAVAADTPLRVLPRDAAILLAGGRYVWRLGSASTRDFGPPSVRVEVPGTWTIAGERHDSAEAAHRAVQDVGWLTIDATATLTVQQAIELCASGGQAVCMVAYGPR